jgi:hypothetical protein
VALRCGVAAGILSVDVLTGLNAMWNKIINRGEKVELELSTAERRVLLSGMVYLHDRVQKAIRTTPPGEPVEISIGDLDDMAGHVAGEANHAKSKRTEEILGGLFDKVERLVFLYAQASSPASSGLATPIQSFADQRLDDESTIFPIQRESGREGGDQLLESAREQMCGVGGMRDKYSVRPMLFGLIFAFSHAIGR